MFKNLHGRIEHESKQQVEENVAMPDCRAAKACAKSRDFVAFMNSQYACNMRLVRVRDVFPHLLGDAAARCTDLAHVSSALLDWKGAPTYLCFGCQLNHRLPEVKLRVAGAHRVLFPFRITRQQNNRAAAQNPC